MLLSGESVDSDGINVMAEPAEALETEERLMATTSGLTLPVVAPRRCSKRPNAGQHSNVYHEPRYGPGPYSYKSGSSFTDTG